MSLGSRITKWGRATITTSLTSTPREPLLFLYPQWIRTLSTPSADTTSARDGSRAEHSGHKSSSELTPPSLVDLREDLRVLQARFNPPKDDVPQTRFSRSAVDGSPSGEKHAIQHPFGRVSRQSKGKIEKVTETRNTIERKIRKVLANSKLAAQNEEHDQGVRKTYQEFKRNELRSWVPDWRVILTDLIQHTPQHGQWLEKALEITTPRRSMRLLFYGIDDYIWELAGKYDCSVQLGHRDRATLEYRTFIISGSATAISKTTADILKVAPDVEIRATANLLPLISPEVSPAALGEIATAGEDEMVVRNVIVEQRRRTLAMPPHKVPIPEEWTSFSFLEYVTNLTTSKVPNHLNKYGYRTQREHRTAVSEILRGLFKNPDCKSSITRTACHEAMAFFVKINRIEDVRVLFVHMDMLGLKLVPETFNIMLRGAAKSEDLHNFHFILHLMLRRGFSPNGLTWTAFMMAHPDTRVKLHILSRMKEKGLLADNSLTMKAACEQLITPEIENSLDLGQSQAEFITHMNARYSSGWLTVDSGNRVLHSLGARGLISRCWEFLHFMESRFIIPDNYSVNTVLHHCKQNVNLAGAVELLRNLPHRVNYVPDDETYRILFDIAWRTRSYNVAKVVWRYACLDAATTSRMRNLVFHSLMHASFVRAAVPTENLTPPERWKRFAGPVILGKNLSGKQHPLAFVECEMVNFIPKGEAVASDEGYSEVSLSTDKYEKYSEEKALRLFNRPTGPPSSRPQTSTSDNSKVSDPQPFTIQTKKEDVEEFSYTLPKGLRYKSPSKAQVHVLQYLLERDCQVFKTFQPRMGLEDMLMEALKRDMEWRKEGMYKEREMEWLISNAVRIKVGRKCVGAEDDVEWG